MEQGEQQYRKLLSEFLIRHCSRLLTSVGRIHSATVAVECNTTTAAS
jgi:hypothetical protein